MGTDANTTSTSGEPVVLAIPSLTTTKATKRRIVKVTHPSSLDVPTNDNKDGDRTTTKNDDDDDDEIVADHSHGKTRHHGISHFMMDQPAVAKELGQEQFAMVKKELLQSAQLRRKQQRAQHVQQLRQRNSATTPAHQNQKDARPPSAFAANPFSRFLSVFSVEPAHPHHKRSWWSLYNNKEAGKKNADNDDVDAETQPPLEKRLRCMEKEEEEEEEEEDAVVEPSTIHNNGWMQVAWISSAVVAAVAMIVAWRWKK